MTYTGLSLYLKFIWNFQVSWNFWSTNFHESVSLFNHCSIFKDKISVANFEKKNYSMWQLKIENRSRGVESTVRNLTTLPRSSNSLLGGVWFYSYKNNRNPNWKLTVSSQCFNSPNQFSRNPVWIANTRRCTGPVLKWPVENDPTRHISLLGIEVFLVES